MPNESDIQPTAQHDVQQRIMEAAGQLFADKGFDATSISDITEAADVGRALIYYYFKDKRDLYDSILRNGGERIINIAEGAYAAEGTAFDRLRQFAAQFRQLHLDRPNLARIAMRSELEGSLVFDAHAEEHFNKVSPILERIVEEGVERGELRSVDPAKTVHMMMGMVHSLAVMQIQGVSDPCPEKDIDFAMSILASGISA
jgi:AcrR family transcriptional regulator